MLIGIDVGGTTTNAVLTDGRMVVADAAVETVSDGLKGSVLAALDGVMNHVRTADVDRIALSTTVITNLLAEDKAEPVGLVLMPGPGTDPADYQLPPAHIVGGAIDFRGQEIAPLDEDGVRAAGAALHEAGLAKVAVVGKFCQRNRAHEMAAQAILIDVYPKFTVECGHLVSGRLNFPRRAATTLLTLATRDRYREFAADMRQALEERGLKAPVFVLKADGGTLPLERSLHSPVETIFSGPAASTMGALALAPEGRSFIMLDVGGTTTDVALVLDGRPLLSSKGARVNGLLTHVRAFATKAVPVGGDSAVRATDGSLTVGPDRVGPAACLGGPLCTPTDALRVLGETDLGDEAAAARAVQSVANELDITLEEAARRALNTAARAIAQEVENMFTHWRDEPVYRIWEVVQEKQARPSLVVGVGGAAQWLAPAAAELLQADYLIPERAAVANALGAALAWPTLTLTYRADTAEKTWIIEEDGQGGRLPEPDLSLARTEEIALEMLARKAEDAGIGVYATQAEITHSEVFNMVRGYSTIGRLVSATAEIPAGLLDEWRTP